MMGIFNKMMGLNFDPRQKNIELKSSSIPPNYGGNVGFGSIKIVGSEINGLNLSSTEWKMAYNYYQSIPELYAIVDKLLKTVKDTFIICGKTLDNDTIEIPSNIIELIDRPNSYTSKQSFIEQFMEDYILSGNVFVLAIDNNGNRINKEFLVSSNIGSLFLLRSKDVSVNTGTTGVLSQTNIVNITYRNNNSNLTIPYSDVIHITNRPCAGLGTSAFNSARTRLEFLYNHARANKNIITRSGALGILQKAQDVKQSGSNTISKGPNRTMTSTSTGSNDSKDYTDNYNLQGDMFLVSRNRMEYVDTIPDVKKLLMSETYKDNLSAVSSAFGVNGAVVFDGLRSTYSNLEVWTESFYNDTVSPLLDVIADFYNMFTGRNITIVVDKNSIPEFKQSNSAKSDRLLKLFKDGIVSGEYVRRELNIDDEFINNTNDGEKRTERI